MALGIIQDIIQMTIRLLVFRSIASALGFAGFGAAGAGAGAAAAAVPVGHSGGRVADLTDRRRYHGGGIVIPATSRLADAMAPRSRMHTGGQVPRSQRPERRHDGVTGDEVPIIAREQETVMTQEQLAAVQNVGRQKPPVPNRGGETVIINVFSPEQLGDALAKHPNAIVNPLVKNRRMVRAALSERNG